jgi:hypothetical protein
MYILIIDKLNSYKNIFIFFVKLERLYKKYLCFFCKKREII